MGFVIDNLKGSGETSHPGEILNRYGDQFTAKNKYGASVPNIDYQNFENDIDYQRKLQEAAVAKQNEVYSQQQALAGMLSQQAAGSGPNPAMAQYQQNVNQAGAQAAGLISSQKGISPALAARMAAQQQSGAMQGAAASGAEMQAKQQLAAQQALMNQQASMQQGANAQGTQALSGQNVFQNAQAAQNTAVTGGSLGAQNINAGVAGQNAQNQNATNQGLMNAAGSVASMFAMSDKRVKKDVEDFDSRSFLEAIKAHKFKYKDQARHGEGQQVGVMAQDVEKEAPQMVVDTPEGKMLDFNKSGGPILASLADINERLEKMESGKNMANGGKVSLGSALKAGGKVPGKAKKSGDHPANDTVHAMLSPGEIVIPRSLVDDPERAKKFIEQIKGRKSYGDVLKAKKKVGA